MGVAHYPYPGDSSAKRVARALLYLRVKKLWDVVRCTRGKVVTLAGEGAEFDLFRNYLNIPPRDMVFADLKAEGLFRVSDKSSRVNVFHGDILKYLKSNQEPLRLVNLDFMGHYRIGKTDEVLEEAARSTIKGGIIAFTFVRGREGQHNKHWALIKNMAAEYVNTRLSSTPRELDEIRFYGYEQLISRILGTNYKLVFHLMYSRSNVQRGINGRRGMSMGMLAFQNMPREIRGSEWIEVLNSSPFRATEEEGIGTTEADETMRSMILHLIDDGMNSHAIAGLFGLRPGNIAAFRAAYTKRKMWRAPVRRQGQVIKLSDFRELRSVVGGS